MASSQPAAAARPRPARHLTAVAPVRGPARTGVLAPAEATEMRILASWAYQAGGQFGPDDREPLRRLARLAGKAATAAGRPHHRAHDDNRMTVAQVAVLTGLYPPDVRDRIHGGTLRATKEGKHWLISRADANALARQVHEERGTRRRP